mgnify:CR=1 FL=1
MDLNVKDRKILAELDLNARASFQEIAKKVRLSKETVIYRVRNLEKREIIGRYTTLVNFSQLGYTGYAVYSRFQNVTEEKKKELIEYLSEMPEVYWIALVGGKFDLVFAVICKSVFQFNIIYYQILTKYGKYLVDNTISIRTELRQHKRKYLSEDRNVKEAPFFGKEPEVEKIDALDEDILSLLSNNARMNIVDIAYYLHKPVSTIALRLNKMEKRNLIQGYSSYICTQKYGVQSYRLLINVEHINELKRKELFSYIGANSFMILGIETVGEWNFEITLEVENHEQLQKQISQLRNHFEDTIKKIEFIIMFEDDLVYDPYPLKKQERKKLIQKKV